MANKEHLARLKQGVEAWNQWRDLNRDIIPDISQVDLREAYLREVDLRGANLCEVILPPRGHPFRG